MVVILSSNNGGVGLKVIFFKISLLNNYSNDLKYLRYVVE
jgi:hypothetical protein